MIAAAWLALSWACLIYGGYAGALAAGGVVVAISVSPRTVWRSRFLIGALMLVLVFAAILAVLIGEHISYQPYLQILGVMMAPILVSKFIDGFWICGWLTRLKVPTGIVLAVAAASSAVPLMLEDMRNLWYHRRRGGGIGTANLLVASFAALLDRLVSIELAFDMFNVTGMLSGWTGRRIQGSEILYLWLLLFPSAGLAVEVLSRFHW